MSKKLNGVNHSMSAKSKTRRQSVIKRLESQLQSKVKTTTIWDDISKSYIVVELSEFDIKRINSEINILKSRI